ncbi:hypothetical protein OIE52_50785 [Streptomyces canus]|uniref:hypothetical protein n=1 Tax=Streptomyces canus TaxID=58343 RepID=UPI0030E2CC9A
MTSGSQPSAREATPCAPADVIEHIRRVPDSFRVFTVTEELTWRFYQLPPSLLEQLLDEGLPVRTGADGLTFDRKDLENLSLALRTSSPQLSGLRLMAAALAAGESGTGPVRTVELTARCYDPSHPGDCRFELLPGVRSSPEVMDLQTLARNRHRVRLRLRGRPPVRLSFGGMKTDLLDFLPRTRFHHLPADLASDLGFMRETGLADCRLACRYLVARGEECGVLIRPASGLFVSRPFSAVHSWVEVFQDDEWLPADPFFLTALARWGLIDGADWPADRSPTGVCWKVSSLYEEPLVSDRRHRAPVSLLTR